MAFDATVGALPEAARAAAQGLVGIREAVLAAEPEAALIADPTLVRGMGYYTGPIFELSHPSSSGSIGGGGRYDGMIGRFLGTDVPGCGFSIGFERILDLVDRSRLGPLPTQVALVYDDTQPLAAVVTAQRQLIEDGATVRLVRRARNMGRLLGDLTAEGFDAYAVLDDPTEHGPTPTGDTPGGLRLRPLGTTG